MITNKIKINEQMMKDLKDKSISELKLAQKYFNGSMTKLYRFRKANKVFKEKERKEMPESNFEEKLRKFADKYWSKPENKNKTPNKTMLPYLFIPKYGLEGSSALLYARILIKKDRELIKLLLRD